MHNWQGIHSREPWLLLLPGTLQPNVATIVFFIYIIFSLRSRLRPFTTPNLPFFPCTHFIHKAKAIIRWGSQSKAQGASWQSDQELSTEPLSACRIRGRSPPNGRVSARRSESQTATSNISPHRGGGGFPGHRPYLFAYCIFGDEGCVCRARQPSSLHNTVSVDRRQTYSYLLFLQD